MKQAILLLTNRTDAVVCDRYDKLEKEYGQKADVFLLFDNSESVDDCELEHFDRIYAFSVPELIDEGYNALESGFLGNCHYSLLKFHKDNPEYDYCWLLEDDVFFSGNWNVFFDAFIGDKSDLLAAKIRNYADDPYWYWWPSVKTPEGTLLSTAELYASFNPIYRLSARALDCLEVEMHNGWRGHFEALIPTILTLHGLSMSDIGNKGFYTNDTHTWIPLQVQPQIPNMIYHPIKEKVQSKTNKKNCLLSVVGKHSCHKEWINGDVGRNYDVHLVVYDSSFGMHYKDADFVYGKSGRKVDLIKDYFDHHKQLLNQYDYFFVIDEMAQMIAPQINSIFEEMKKGSNEFSLVGMTMPCFSQETMRQLLNEDLDCSVIYFK
jgi:hypothetical protein